MDTFSGRKLLIIGIFILSGVIFILRLFQIQVVDSTYKVYAQNNALRKMVQYPARGLIYDRNKELLVYNKPAYDLLFTPREAGKFDTLFVSRLMDVPPDVLKSEMKKAASWSTYKPSVIVKQIPPEKYAAIQEKLFRLKGFYIQPRTLREYPRPVSAHILGYIGEVTQSLIDTNSYYQSGDYIGISGVESAYEKELRGGKGVKYYLVNVYNQLQGSYRNGETDTIAHVGKNLVITIDSRLQDYAESLLQNKKGSVVAIQPSTGEILALANSPSYNPKQLAGPERSKNWVTLVEDPAKPLFNRALMAMYPPGSTIKMAQALIALQEGVITPETRFYCAGGYVSGNFRLGCHHDQSFDLESAISASCNTYFVYVLKSILENKAYPGVKEAYQAWRDYMFKFGFGHQLGTDFPGELKGIVPSTDYFQKYVFKNSRWRALPIISLSIGQGELGISPLQLANYSAMLANRGYYYIPHVIKEIEGKEIPAKFTAPVETGISKVYFEPLIAGMEKAMLPGGTAAMSMISGIAVCGKTGTAQNPHGANHSVFMAFAPKENPQIALSVYVENGEAGATYAAPIASLLIEKYLNDTISNQRIWLENAMLRANLINPVRIPGNGQEE